MDSSIDHIRRDKHAATMCVISGLGVLYFLGSLCAWTRHLSLFGDVYWGLSASDFIELVVVPVGECLVLLASFLTALAFCWRRKRGTEFMVCGCAAIATAAFLVDIHFSRAQIHVFGPPGINHFYANWWLYSCGPHLAPSIRYPFALIIVSSIAGVVWFSRCHFGNGGQLKDRR